MIAIKDMEMPRVCTEVIETQNEKGWTDASIKNCPLYNVCKHRETIKTNYKPTDCPLVEIEERKTGKWLSAEEYALKIGAKVTEDIKNSLYKFCPFCEQTVFTERNFCPNCGADMKGVENENIN